MNYNFWGAAGANVTPVNGEYKGINSPCDLYDALSGIWSAETCAPRMRENWTKENMTLGQCSITAFLAQDIFGGEVYGVPLEGGGYHCYNVVGDCRFDLASEQFTNFGIHPDFDHDNVKQTREEHFSSEEKYQRYLILCTELKKMTTKNENKHE